MTQIDLINGIETDLKFTVDDVMRVIKTLRADVDNLQKDCKKLKKKLKTKKEDK